MNEPESNDKPLPLVAHLTELRDKGRAEAEQWLGSCSKYLGTGQSSVDLQKEFLQD